MRRDSRLQGGGGLSQPLVFFAVQELLDPESAVQRTPVEAYRAFGEVSPYLGLETRDALREIGETWSTISIRYHKSRVPLEGMQVLVRLTGETYEIRGTAHLDFSRKKVELTCRLIR